jgi:MarR family 2-MHQ and catechol resistance regulon transcriptional repressor
MAMPDPLQHPHLTTLGLLCEAEAGLRRQFERQLVAQTGLSVQWFEVLLRLARTPGRRLKMSELASQTTLTPSGLTRAVDRLVGEGYVERQACPEDRRSAYAALTAAGEARIEAAVPMHLAHAEEVLDSALSPAELEVLTAVLRRLRDAVAIPADRPPMCDLLEEPAASRP